ncbi:hypothetical protein HK100_004021 [Physocladia obscura]|uniref:Uncharacterized protein n=1 Tax=Physocladia obscura TaxID=109957 RepID=A0AAD5SUC3_9FUNG|nr:hypothetical protein HK100_004021 [Physocladia obscura]
MSNNASKKQQLLNTVKVISKTLDANIGADESQSQLQHSHPSKVVGIPKQTANHHQQQQQQITTNYNTSSIFSAPTVFDKPPPSKISASNQTNASLIPSTWGIPPINANTSRMKESIKSLEEKNRKLHFEKAALVSTLIDIKPPAARPSTINNQNNSVFSPVEPTQPIYQLQQHQALNHMRFGEGQQETSQIQQQQQPQSQHLLYQQHQIDELMQKIRRQSLDIESLTSQTTILAAENKRLRSRTLELESALISSECNENTPDNHVTEAELSLNKQQYIATYKSSLQNMLSQINKRKTALIDAFENTSFIASGKSIQSASFVTLPFSEIACAINSISDAFALAASTAFLASTDNTSELSHTALTAALTSLDQTIAYHTSKSPPALAVPTIEPKLVADLASLYVSEIDAYSSFRTHLQGSFATVVVELEAVRAEQSKCQRECEELRNVAHDAVRVMDEAMKAKEAIEVELQQQQQIKDDPNIVKVDFAEYTEKLRQLEFENARLKGAEANLETLVSEWKGENQTLRRMVDEVSEVSANTRTGGTELEKLRKEIDTLRGNLEDEKLRYAKSKEVIRVLRGGIQDLENLEENGSNNFEVDKIINTMIVGGTTSRVAISSHMKALHDSVGRSLVDFDELVTLISENNALKQSIVELNMKLEEQEKRLQISLASVSELKKNLETTIISQTSSAQTYESTTAKLQESLYGAQTEVTRLTLEATYAADLNNNYATQFQRIEFLAADWFDVKAEHFLNMENQLLHGMNSKLPPSIRLVNFESMFARLLSILKDVRERLKESEVTLSRLKEKFDAVTISEKVFAEKQLAQTAKFEAVKATKDSLVVQLADLETQFEAEYVLRKSLEIRLKKIVRGSLALLDIPVDSILLKVKNSDQIIGTPSPQKKTIGRSSPSRDTKNGEAQI